jgi:hypothetical protein
VPAGKKAVLALQNGAFVVKEKKLFPFVPTVSI